MSDEHTSLAETVELAKAMQRASSLQPERVASATPDRKVVLRLSAAVVELAEARGEAESQSGMAKGCNEEVSQLVSDLARVRRERDRLREYLLDSTDVIAQATGVCHFDGLAIAITNTITRMTEAESARDALQQQLVEARENLQHEMRHTANPTGQRNEAQAKLAEAHAVIERVREIQEIPVRWVQHVPWCGAERCPHWDRDQQRCYRYGQLRLNFDEINKNACAIVLDLTRTLYTNGEFQRPMTDYRALLPTPPGKSAEKAPMRTGDMCDYAYWDHETDGDGDYYSGPFCGCEKAKAPYGGGAGACGGPCEFWVLRGRGDHRELPATDEDYGWDPDTSEGDNLSPVEKSDDR